MNIPVVKSNIFDVMSKEPVPILLQLGENLATTTSALCPHTVRKQCPVREHQTLAVLSKEPVTILSLKEQVLHQGLIKNKGN